MLYSDEASVALASAVSHTYAPRGRPPTHARNTEMNIRLYAASAVGPGGEFCYVLRRQPFDTTAIIEYVELVERTFCRPLLLIWDGASIHRSEQMRRYLAGRATKSKTAPRLERQPAYSPELNADEQVWAYLKASRLKDTLNTSLAELEQRVTTALDELKQNPQLVRNFFRHPNLGFYK